MYDLNMHIAFIIENVRRDIYSSFPFLPKHLVCVYLFCHFEVFFFLDFVISVAAVLKLLVCIACEATMIRKRDFNMLLYRS